MKYCRKCGSKMSEDAVFCSKCGCKFIEPEETDEIIKDTADKTEISSKTELYPEEYPTEEENTDMQLQNDLSARYSVEQNDINDNVPPLLKELSLMYEKIAKYSLATGIVEFLGAAVVILIGTAFIAQPERLLVPGIIFIIYGIGAAVTGLLNIIKFFKGNKFCKIIKSDPSQALEESLDIFMDENKYARLMKSTESLDTLNIFFRFYKDIKYAQKHEYIKAFIEENNKELSDIYSAYSAIDQGKEITDEMQKSLSSFPKTSYSNKLNLRIRTILTGICLIILIPVVIWLNKLMREPEYAKQVGEDLRAHSVTQQEGSVSEKETPSNITTPQQYTAEEFMDRYNELASNYGSVINSFDFSKATKGQEDGLLYFEILNDEHDKAIHLGTESNDYTGNIHWVNIQYLIPEGQDSIYPSEVANVITVFIKNLPLADASAACEQTVEKGEYTDSQIAGITLYYEKDSSYNTENWFILLSGEDSTTMQSSNQTDIKTEESSRVSEKETSTVQESEVSKVKETSEASQKQESSKSDSKKTIYPQGIYDRVVEILHNNIYSDMDLEYSFGHIIGSDDLFMFVKRGDTTASRFISAYQITDKSVYLIDGAFSGGANSLYVNDKDQVGIYYAKQGYSYYGMVTYEYGKLVHHTEYESDESSMSVPPPCPGEWIKWASVSDLTLLKEVILVETDSVSETNTTNEIVYSDRLFYYNDKILYTSKIEGQTNFIHLFLSDLGNSYIALPLPDYSDAETQKYTREINIDSFLIVDDIVYFTDQEPGSAYTMPARLYKMKLDGSDVKPIVSNVDVGFCYKDGNIYFSSRYSLDRPDSGESGIIYAYNISTEQISKVDENISFDRSNSILSYNKEVEFHNGIYFIEKTGCYRKDTLTGEIQLIGYRPEGGQS